MKSGRSVGFKKCVELARRHLGLSDEQLGLLRALNALRDDEQHWLAELNEGLLYVHARATITLFDEILESVFGERLASHLPERVLTISTKPIVPRPRQLRGARLALASSAGCADAWHARHYKVGAAAVCSSSASVSTSAGW
jgi:hypothetical protein